MGGAAGKARVDAPQDLGVVLHRRGAGRTGAATAGLARFGIRVKTDQHCQNLAELNRDGLCPEDAFLERVSFRPVDMNAIPDDLCGFDFVWSSCSLEHLGSLAHGEQFLYNSLGCLKPGGVAVHTTEYNVSSNTETADYRSTVVYRRCDLERMTATASDCGHKVARLDLDPGDLPVDRIVDVPPYSHDPHLKLLLKSKYVCTSVGVIVEKGAETIPQGPRYVTRRNIRAVLRPWGTRARQLWARCAL
jgi:hypothetical protein